MYHHPSSSLTGKSERTILGWLALGSSGTCAWRAAGKVWKPVSSRVIMARLKWTCQWRQRSVELLWLLFVSMLQLPRLLLMLGPSFWNSCRICWMMFLKVTPLWCWETLMPGWVCLILLIVCGMGLLVDMELQRGTFVGEEFLQFCESNQLTVMNTCFQKKPILGTWVHVASKHCHMTNFVVMRTNQRKFCLDVQVMRGANCWTDHYMVRATLRMLPPLPTSVKKHPLPFAMHKFARPELLCAVFKAEIV